MEIGSEDNILIWIPASEDDKIYPGNKRKIEWVNYKGGKCLRCGYNECVQSLTFHHVDPSRKVFSINPGGNGEEKSAGRTTRGRTSEEIYNELDKCVLLCFNCHQELHAGKWKITELISPNREKQLELC